MNLWIRKITVVLVAIMTLGLYIPPTDITDAESKGSSVSSEAEINNITEVVEDTHSEVVHADLGYEARTMLLTEKAKEQALEKLGPRIVNQLEGEFTEVILPKIEDELQDIFAAAGEEKIPYYEITENPSTGYGERIFNVYDHHLQENVAKFHIRRVHRPLEGYWFNFHYHLQKDGFETHYDIGDIYWDKNMPPKWMS